MRRVGTPRWAWALTGSGYFLNKSLDLIRSVGQVDLFLSRAAAEVVERRRAILQCKLTARA